MKRLQLDLDDVTQVLGGEPVEDDHLIDPFRTPGGTRRYSREDIERLQLIQELTSQGLNLEGVRRVLTLQEENRVLKRKVDKLRDKLDDLEDEMEQRIEEVRRDLAWHRSRGNSPRRRIGDPRRLEGAGAADAPR